MNDKYPDPRTVKNWCKNILNGLKYLHEFGKLNTFNYGTYLHNLSDSLKRYLSS
jgi:hypothetical protein